MQQAGAAVLFGVLLALNVLRWLIVRSKTGFLQQHKARLIVEIASLRRQAEAHNNPSTFHKSAKFQRLANAKEKELASLQEAQKPSLQDTIDQMVVVVKVVFIAIAIVATWGKPLVTVPPDWTWPFGRLLSFPHSSTYLEVGAITVIPWVTLCDRVSQAVARAAFPPQMLDLRTKPLQPVKEEHEH